MGCKRSVAPATPTASPDGSSSGSAIEFVDGFQLGYRRATAEGKPLLILFTARWCDHCHEMLETTFNEDEVARLAKDFVCVRVDADSEPEVCRDFRVRYYPTIQFISPRGVPLNRLTGSQPAERVVTEMRAAQQATARRLDVANEIFR